MPVEQINAIKLLERSLSYASYPYTPNGREATIVNGIFQGIRGKIVERRGSHRFILSVDAIKRSIMIEVDIEDVEID